MRRLLVVELVVGSVALVAACDGASTSADAPMGSDAVIDDAAIEIDASIGPCPDDMALVGTTCMDRFEAPNIAGAKPLVMYTFVEADAWCGARQKRLCFDDEWQFACEGPAKEKYPYGDTRQAGACNDNKTWKPYTQSLLNGWPASASTPSITSLDELLDLARTKGTSATSAANHVLALYQGTGGGEASACEGESGVMDLVGNVEEWTRRRDGGMALFHGSLKGRYWAEARTCQSAVTTHGDNFRFYEIGFRCCSEPTK
jgi:formylglycine-generating enzyme required for sulfatase activity